MATTRTECIKNNEVCIELFSVVDNPAANGDAPFYEFPDFSDVDKYAGFIDVAAFEKGIDKNLIKAIIFMETTHGYYDAPLSLIDMNKSILPMNVNVAYWGDTFGTREDLLNPFANIRAGTEMLNRIKKNFPTNSIEKIATLYNNIKATKVNDYGMRVKKIYEAKPWFELSIPGVKL